DRPNDPLRRDAGDQRHRHHRDRLQLFPRAAVAAAQSRGNGMSLLQIEAITKRFGPVTAVDKFSLEVKDGEFFAILGPSGCGKTTLLRVIAGFEVPDEGHVRLAGADITELKANRRPVNLMFQSHALFPHMTVFGNVAYGLEMEGLHGAALKARVAEALAMVRMTDYAARKPGQLPGGQSPRIAP